MMYGVLITFLVTKGVYDFNKSEMGWLIGIPVLTGALLRLPVGILTDKYGGRKIFTIVMLISAIPMFLVSFANGFWTLFLAGLGFGITGTSFAVGIAYTSLWFKQKNQGTALGIFGAGNAGAALTAVFAPQLLNSFTGFGTNLEGWRILPRMYAVMLLAMAVVFWLFTYERKVPESQGKSLKERLHPLRHIRVWRFGLYYFLVFGGFVALSQWLVPYYINVYTVSVAAAGFFTAIFSFPSGVIRALGGWMSDKFGARSVMYWILGITLVSCLFLMIPKMNVLTPGKGIIANKAGVVTSITESVILVDEGGPDPAAYSYKPKEFEDPDRTYGDEARFLPTIKSWQEPAVKVDDAVERKQLLARGVTNIIYQANIYVFTFVVFIVGVMMGIGKAAVYKHIPTYFPKEVGVVGGIVGVVGGLGGFIGPVIFGYLLEWTGLWITTWVFFAILTAVCLIWMHSVVRKMMAREAPGFADRIDSQERNNKIGRNS
jgi:NNP family nitrate/nitrite transporter-like MFS transporter